jgi:hypothetical protein
MILNYPNFALMVTFVILILCNFLEILCDGIMKRVKQSIICGYLILF